MFEEAAKALERSDLAAAETAYRQIIAVKPDHGPSLGHLFTVLLFTGRTADAFAILENLARVVGNEPMLEVYRFAATSQGGVSQEVQELLGALERQPEPRRQMAARYLMGVATFERQRRNFGAADWFYFAASRLDPAFIDIWTGWAQLAETVGDFKKAVTLQRQATSVSPHDPRLRTDLARLLSESGDPRAALEALSQFDELIPRVMELKGDSLARLGQYQEALPYYRFLPDAGLKAAAMMLATGAIESAAMIAREAIARRDATPMPTDPVAAHDLQVLTVADPLPTFCQSHDMPLTVLPQPLVRRMGTREEGPSAFLACLRNGGVIGKGFVPVSEDGHVFAEQVLHNPTKLRNTSVSEFYDGLLTAMGSKVLAHAPARRHVDGPALLIGGHWNFGHWLWNHFARLMFAGDKRMPLIVSADMPDSHRQCLARAGFTDADLIAVDTGERVNVDELWIPSMPFHGYGPRGHLFFAGGVTSFVRQSLKVPENQPGTRRLFLPRAGARWRHLANEEDVIAALEPLGFEIVAPGELSIDQQIAIASEAAIIVSPFGAAMNLMAFAPRETQIVELKTDHIQMDINPFLASELGQTYRAVLANWVDSRADNPLEADFKVSVANVVKAVEQAIADQEAA